MVGVAIGGAALLGAGATIYAGSQAASAQQKSDAAAIAEQQREYNQTRSDFAPWRAAGQTALGSLMSAYGLGGNLGSAGNTPGAAGTQGGITGSGASSGGPGAYGGFFESPGYQFRLQQGLQAIDRGAAARGELGSGATIKAEQRYGEGLASSEFNNYVGGLSNIAGLGQSATGQTAAAGSSAANNISQELIASGNARASSYTNAASGINSGLNNVMSAYLMNNMGMFGGGSAYAGGGNMASDFGAGMAYMSDRRLKTKIRKVGEFADGLGIYEFAYKSDPDQMFKGVMADEVETLRPWAFIPNFRDGYAGVDYGALGGRHG